MKELEEKVAAALGKIRERDSEVNSFIDVYAEEALEKARELDSRLKKKQKVGRLAGLIVAVKNNIAIRGKRMTCSSKMLENYAAPYSATVVEKLLQEDAIIIGSTNLDEFACGSDTTQGALKKTKNPLDLQRVPGGSSGGSAAAVAANFSDAALGSDTGGSIRCPASFCGVVGFKPTYGLVSRYGLADLAMTFDCIGPLARDVSTASKILGVIAGRDYRDTTTFESSEKNYASLPHKPPKMRIGIVKEFFEGCDGKISGIVMEKAKALQADGFELVDLSFPMAKYSLPIYYLLVYSEFASAMQKYDGLRFGQKIDLGKDLVSSVSEVRSDSLGREIKRRILLGAYVTSKEHKEQWYSKALKARRLFRDSMEKLLSKADVLLFPAMPVLPWKIGEKIEDPLQMYLADVLTTPANICGLPAGVVQAGKVGKLPVGLQVMGRAFEDEKVLQVLKKVEEL